MKRSELEKYDAMTDVIVGNRRNKGHAIQSSARKGSMRGKMTRAIGIIMTVTRYHKWMDHYHRVTKQVVGTHPHNRAERCVSLLESDTPKKELQVK